VGDVNPVCRSVGVSENSEIGLYLQSKSGAFTKLPYLHAKASLNLKQNPIFNPNCISKLNSMPGLKAKPIPNLNPKS